MSAEDKQCKLCRREGEKLFLKGGRCTTNKCSFDRRSYVPGVHGQKMRRKPSDVGIHLREKQKAKRMYGVSERQFAGYFRQAAKTKGVTGVRFLQLLESRLDNIVFRLGLAVSRSQARQLVGHGHIHVNDRKVDVASFRVRVGDVISVREKSRKFIAGILEAQGERTPPDWLDFSSGELVGKVVALPDGAALDAPIQDNLIVEYYSK